MHVGASIALPTIMVRSAKHFGLEVVQLTDLDSPRVVGVDDCIRADRGSAPLMYWRAQRYAEYGMPGVYVDTDLMFRRDPSPVFGLDFDVALTKRDQSIMDKTGREIGHLMPFNGGVLFVRTPRFLDRVATVMRPMGPELRKWYGDQLAIARVADEFATVNLPVEVYNYTPKRRDDDISRAWIVHYKGERKDWMLNA